MQNLLINHPALDFDAAVQCFQEYIEMQRANAEANKILKNEAEYLLSEYRIAHAELLLSLLYGLRRPE